MPIIVQDCEELHFLSNVDKKFNQLAMVCKEAVARQPRVTSLLKGFSQDRSEFNSLLNIHTDRREIEIEILWRDAHKLKTECARYSLPHLPDKPSPPITWEKMCSAKQALLQWYDKSYVLFKKHIYQSMQSTHLNSSNEASTKHNADFTMVNWFGAEYHFALGVQSSAVKALWEEWEKTGLGLNQQTIRDAIDNERDNFRMANAFRNHPAMKTMIQSDGNGRYRLVRPEPAKKIKNRRRINVDTR